MEKELRKELVHAPRLMVRAGWVAFLFVGLAAVLSQFILSKQFVSIRADRQALEDRMQLFSGELERKQNRITEMREYLAQHQPAFDQIRSEQAKLKGELAAAVDGLTSARAKKQEALEELRYAQVERDNATNEANRIRSEMTAVAESLNRKKGELDSTREELATIRESLSRLRGQEGVFQQRIQSLMTSVASLAAQEELLKSNVEGVEKMAFQAERLKSDIDDLISEKNKLREDVNGLNAQKDDLSSEVATLRLRQATLVEQARQKTSLDADVQAINEEISQLISHRAQLQSEIRQIAESTGTLQNLLETISSKRSELEGLRRQTGEAEEKHARLMLVQNELVQTQNSVDRAQSLVQQKEGQVLALDEAIANRRSILGMLQEQIRLAEAEIDQGSEE